MEHDSLTLSSGIYLSSQDYIFSSNDFCKYVFLVHGIRFLVVFDVKRTWSYVPLRL